MLTNILQLGWNHQLDDSTPLQTDLENEKKNNPLGEMNDGENLGARWLVWSGENIGIREYIPRFSEQKEGMGLLKMFLIP